MNQADMKTRRITARSGFSLIELLVVIAIIAILAAILFPTFNRARETARQGTCLTQMHEIGQDLKLYFLDNQKYPSILLCNPYVSNNTLYTGSGTPLSAGDVLNRPFATGQKYNKDVSIFQCPDNAANNNRAAVTNGAVYPPGVPLSGATAAWYYSFDSYDTGPQIDKTGNAVAGVREVHYALDWTGATGAADPPNQLKYPNPDENKTVVTWCSYHASVAHSDQLMVLLLNGTTKATHYSKFVYQDATHPNGPLYFSP
jgi:prepilin-type N-terminal cleavage/methylation domain-containing protein